MNNIHIDVLKQNKLSLTPVRLAVLAAIESHPHSEADTIFKIVKESITTTSKQAIYQNLRALVECSILREIKPKGRASLFETHKHDNHHHLACKYCHSIMDTDCFDSAPCLRPMTDHGFMIDEAEITFWGTCPSCQKTELNKG